MHVLIDHVVNPFENCHWVVADAGLGSNFDSFSLEPRSVIKMVHFLACHRLDVDHLSSRTNPTQLTISTTHFDTYCSLESCFTTFYYFQCFHKHTYRQVLQLQLLLDAVTVVTVVGQGIELNFAVEHEARRHPCYDVPQHLHLSLRSFGIYIFKLNYM